MAALSSVKVNWSDLKDEVALIRKSHPRLKDDSAFVLWFLRAYLADSEDAAVKALTGATGDKSIDAIFFDDKVKQVHVIQGKYRQSDSHGESRSDVLSFADLSTIPWEEKNVLAAFYNKLDPLVRSKFEELVKRVRSQKYALRLYYVTTGKCSKTIVNEAKERAWNAEGQVELRVFDSKGVLNMLKDYLEGVAPAVPTLFLPLASEGPIINEGAVHRFDPRKGVESWVFSMETKDIAEMYDKAGIRLFARNIRGYLGGTEINESMAQTIRDEPDNFWYYNNGVTIVCDDMKREVYEGKDVMRVERPQVINGQQTTRTLSKESATKGSVLLKVIKIRRHAGDDEEYDQLVNSIVRATNWQNYIEPSDLVSNDYVQVSIERSLRKVGYQYIRKRQTKSEARSLMEGDMFQIDKREMAQAVGACLLDPATVRKGKEGLFEDPYYKAIFSTNSTPYYLSRYWLMRRVQYVARGKPERAYAKWLALNFAWSWISADIGSGEKERKFRYNSEYYNDNEVLYPLNKALDFIFKSIHQFFVLERGKGEKARDPSTFFQRTNLDTDFKQFRNSSKNRHRRDAEERIDRFRDALEEFELPQ